MSDDSIVLADLPKRRTKCATCPYLGPTGDLPDAITSAVSRGLLAGDEWVCHSSVGEGAVTASSQLCAGARSGAERREMLPAMNRALAESGAAADRVARSLAAFGEAAR